MARQSSRATCFSCAVLGYFCLLYLLWICTQPHSPAPCLVSFLLHHYIELKCCYYFAPASDILGFVFVWCHIFRWPTRCWLRDVACFMFVTGDISWALFHLEWPKCVSVCFCTWIRTFGTRVMWSSKGVRGVCVVCCCRCLDEFEESVWFPIGYLHSVCDVSRDIGSACFCVHVF